jgi:polyisoprenoid-binding protein YceI
MPSSKVCKRYAVDGRASSLTYEAKSSLQVITGRAEELDGYVQAAWTEEGALLADPAPAMHLEVPVTRLRSGSTIKDQEVWRLIDVERSPTIFAELRSIESLYAPLVYRATGDVTLGGTRKAYAGQLVVAKEGPDAVSVRGDLEIDIRDYGLEPPRALFVRIEPVIVVHLSLVATA